MFLKLLSEEYRQIGLAGLAGLLACFCLCDCCLLAAYCGM